MKTVEEYLNIKFPRPSIPGQWFVDNDLPMIVECTCCGSTMSLPSAFVDYDGCIYCPSCAGND